MNSEDYKKWQKDLRGFVAGILVPILGEEMTIKLVGEQSMKVWMDAFTHETFNPINNYEALEYLGDMVLKSVFADYLMNRIPNLKNAEFTELNRAYMSAEFQSEMAYELGLQDHILILGVEKAGLKIVGDLFESFIGALSRTSDIVYTRGLGYVNCSRMIEYLFRDQEIDMNKAQGNDKTQVQQIFTRFGKGKPEERRVEADRSPDGLDHIYVILTEDQLNFIFSYNSRTPRKRIAEIGHGSAPTKNEASIKAYKQALDNLRSLYGITTEWAQKAKLALDIQALKEQGLLDRLNTKIRNEGYISFHFSSPRKTTSVNGSVVQLIGITSNKEQVPLSTIFMKKDRDNKDKTRGKEEVVRKYLEM